MTAQPVKIKVKKVSSRLRGYRERFSKPRLYVGIDHESPGENFAFRFDRPVKLYRQALPEILKKLGLPEDTKASWSQKAGCSCGCSPGFILDLPAGRVDYWATLAAETPKVVEHDGKVSGRVGDRAKRFAEVAQGGL